MSLDRRLRDGLQRSSSVVDPDVPESLSIVRRKARRLVVRQRVGQVTFAALAVAALFLAGPRILDVVRSLRPVRPASPGPAVSTAIAGTYTTEVPAGSSVVRDNHLAGRWTMHLAPNGVVTVTAPPSFTGVLTGVSYQVAGSQLRIDLFLQDICGGAPPGAYQWRRAGDSLTFTVVNDSCAARVAVLTSGTWTSSG